MTNKKLIGFAFFSLAIIISFIVHYRWFDNLSIISFGDWGYYYNGTLKDFFTIPYLWSSAGLGGVNLTASGYPTILAFAVFEKLKLNFNISERVLYLIPYTILSAGSSFLLIKKITKSSIASVIGSFVYCYNVYFLILSQSDFTILMAIAIAPIAILLYIITLERGKYYLSFITGLVLFVASIYEFRMFYITAIISIFYSIYYFIFINKIYKRNFILKYIAISIIPFIIILLLNFYWLYPFYHSGLIATNNLFSRGLFGNSYLDILHAITITLPWWTGKFDAVFVVQQLASYFWILPIAAFFGLFVKRKDPNVIFFGIVAIIGVLLSKQVDNPFPNVYQYLFDNIIGFNAFREASKFFFVSALGYSVLVGAFIAWLFEYFKNSNILWKQVLKYAVVGIVALSVLYNTKPLLNGSFAASFQPKFIPNDYTVFANYVKAQPDFFRTYWVPFTSRWSYYDNLHPMLQAYDATGGAWTSLNQYMNVSSNAYYGINRLLQQDFSEKLLNAADIKYLVVPTDDTANEEILFDNTTIYGSRSYFLSTLDSLPYLKRVNIGTTQLAIYQNIGYVPNSYLSLANDGNISYQIPNTTNIAIYNVLLDARACNAQIYTAITTIDQSLGCKFVQYNVAPNSTFDLSFSYDSKVNIITYNNDDYKDYKTLTIDSNTQKDYEDVFNTNSQTTSMTIIIVTQGTNNGYTLNEKLTRINQVYDNDFFPVSNSANASVSYQIINPTKKTFTIKNVSQPVLLSMSEQQDPNWALFINGAIQGPDIHLTRYNTFNAWVINPQTICTNSSLCVKNANGTYNITGTIEYNLQSKANKALIISIISGIGIILMLGFLKLKNY